MSMKIIRIIHFFYNKSKFKISLNSVLVKWKDLTRLLVKFVVKYYHQSLSWPGIAFFIQEKNLFPVNCVGRSNKNWKSEKASRNTSRRLCENKTLPMLLLEALHDGASVWGSALTLYTGWSTLWATTLIPYLVALGFDVINYSTQRQLKLGKRYLSTFVNKLFNSCLTDFNHTKWYTSADAIKAFCADDHFCTYMA